MDLNVTNKPTAITELATSYNVIRTRPNPVVHVIGVEKMKRHTYKLVLSDGFYTHDAYADCKLKRSKQLQEGSIIRLAEYLRAIVDNTTVIKVLDVNVIGTKYDIIGHPIPFRYSVTAAVEDCCHDSLPEDKHPLLKGSCSSGKDCFQDSLPEVEHHLIKGSCISTEDYCHGSLPEDEHPVSCSSDEDHFHDSLYEEDHPLLKGSFSSDEDHFHDSLYEEEHPLFEGSCSSAGDNFHDSLPEDEHPLLKGSYSSVEDYFYDSLPEDEHPLLKGRSCISVEEELDWGTETEDGFIMLEKSLDYELL